MAEKRFYDLLPNSIKNDKRKKASSMGPDLLYQPANMEVIEGFIGDVSDISEERLKREPEILPRGRTDNLLSTAVAITNGSEITNGAFFSDIIGYLAANGADTSNISRLFECDYYSFNPPIDVDAWLNFSKYIWTGTGTTTDIADYMVKDQIGQKTVFHRLTSNGTFVEVPVFHSDLVKAEFPNGTVVGELREDSRSDSRAVYVWTTASEWSAIIFKTVSELPVNTIDIPDNTYFYVASVKYQTRTLRRWSEPAGRWIAYHPVVSETAPLVFEDGVVWEDATSGISRSLKIRSEGLWIPLDYHTTDDLDDIDIDDLLTGTDYVYHLVALEATDAWSQANKWRHVLDLSETDKALYKNNASARPIISFWAGLELFDNVKSRRNQPPSFEVYLPHTNNVLTKVSSFSENYSGNYIYTYQRGIGLDDPILGFPLQNTDTGELVFRLDLEHSPILFGGSALKGYRFFKDIETDKLHTVWTKSLVPLETVPGQEPLNWTNNPDHALETSLSRKELVQHYKGIIQANSTGAGLGFNHYRWSFRDPVNGAGIIDTEAPLQKMGAILTDPRLDIVTALQRMSREYSRFMKRFTNRLTQLWGQQEIINGDDEDETVDLIINQIVMQGDPSKPFNSGVMGTFVREPFETDEAIPIPTSIARFGGGPLYEPRIVSYPEGSYILGHDGSLVPSFEDFRDDILIALETRFYNQVPAHRRNNTNESARSPLFDQVFSIDDYCKAWTPATNYQTVLRATDDYASMTEDGFYFDTVEANFKERVLGVWSTISTSPGLIFYSEFDEEYYVITENNYFTIDIFNDVTSDYNRDEYYLAALPFFERWVLRNEVDPKVITVDEDDRFTWNYSTSGQLANWKAIYKHIYKTDRPHQAPWECLGFSVKPLLWDALYTEDAPGVWYSTNPMWADLKTGALWDLEGEFIHYDRLLPSSAPIPVDTTGELLDPVTLGIMDLDSVQTHIQNWEYGDMSPEEFKFFSSYEGRFVHAIVSFLLKPARFFELLWTDYIITLGDDGVRGGALRVNNETLTRKIVSDPNNTDAGLKSCLIDYLKLLGSSPDVLDDLINSSKMTLAWKTQGFVSTSTMQLKTSSGLNIPFEDIFVKTHRSLPLDTVTMSGVHIQKRGAQYKVYGYDTLSPYFVVDQSNKPIIGGKIVKEEKFTAQSGQTEFTLTTFKVKHTDLGLSAILINGFKIPSSQYVWKSDAVVEILRPVLIGGENITVAVQTVISNATTRARKFEINGLLYFYYPESNNTKKFYVYGHPFDTEQEIVEFLYEYGRELSYYGWTFTSDWIEVAKKFINWTRTADEGDIFVGVPNDGRVELELPFGQVDDLTRNSIEISVTNFAGLPADDMTIDRNGSQIIFKSSDSIYFVRTHVVEIQHVVFLSSRTKFNDVIYDTFTGIRQNRLSVRANRTSEWNGRVDVDGYLLGQNGLIENFETHASQSENLYNTVNPIDNKAKRDLAWGAYGWRYSDYMDAANISPISSFDYHKRMIREKGTFRAMEAFSRSKISGNPLRIRECWAWKLADFGKNSNTRNPSWTIYRNDIRAGRQIVDFGQTGVGIQVPEHTDYNNPIWVIRPDREVYLKDPEIPDYTLELLSVGNDYSFFEWNPRAGKHEPLALSQIDIRTPFDPASYTNGGLNVLVDHAWGPSQLGTIWLKDDNVRYINYEDDEFTLEEKAERWGRFISYDVNSFSSSEEDGDLLVNIGPHDFEDEQTCIAITSDGLRYRAFIIEALDNEILLTILDDSGEKIFQNTNGPNFSDVIRIEYGDIEVYEWVESRFPPVSAPLTDRETLLNPGENQYSRFIDPDTGVIKYYFWVRNRQQVVPGKTLSVTQIENRLRDPTGNILPWFGILDRKALVFNSTVLTNTTDYQAVLRQFREDEQPHDQWVIVVDKEDIYPCSELVFEKLVSSLAGVDTFGRTIPFPSLNGIVRYGVNDGQTVFQNVDRARTVFLSSVERIMKGIDRTDQSGFLSAFPASLKNITWQEMDYDKLGYVPSQKVVTESQKEALIDNFENDVVRVNRSFMVEGSYRYASYQYIDDVWIKVQSEKTSARLLPAVFNNFHAHARNLFEYLTAEQGNSIIMDLIHEMVIQNNDCDWCIKTSLVDLINPSYASQPKFISPDNTDIIYNAWLDTKPYRVKARRLVSELILAVDDLPYDLITAEVVDSNVLKIQQNVDRLSCNLYDDFAYDVHPYDTEAYDWPSWARDRLATNDWETIMDTVTTAGVKLYNGPFSTSVYRHQLYFVNSLGQLVDPATHTIQFIGGRIRVQFAINPTPGTRFIIRRATGIASASLVEDGDFEHTPAVQRGSTTGYHNNRVATEPASGFGCVDLTALDGGTSEERIRIEMVDVLVIDVTTTPRTIHGYDYEPYGTDLYDAPPV